MYSSGTDSSATSGATSGATDGFLTFDAGFARRIGGVTGTHTRVIATSTETHVGASSVVLVEREWGRVLDVGRRRGT